MNLTLQRSMSFLKRRVVPVPWRMPLETAYYDVMLFADGLRGMRYDMVPPMRMMFIGGRVDFVELGHHFLRILIDVGGLRPDETVLDIGCGIGRIAIPMTAYLTEGSYEGFDTVPFAIKWCRRHITPRFPKFRFAHADIYNHSYNPGGTVRPEAYRYPYADATFDFAYAISVFTHLVQASSENYLRELRRVLKPGGRALLTWFILNDASRRAINEGLAADQNGMPFTFAHQQGALWANDPDYPEHAIAANDCWLRDALRGAGLTVESIRYGGWCGTENPTTFQDIVIVRKP